MTIKIIAILAICLACAANGSAQPAMTCVTNAGVSTPLRAEGTAELASDFLVTCSGGVPTSQGSPVPTVDIAIFLNTAITSKLLSGSWSEALLIVDEPAPGVQRVCGTSGDVEPSPGVCAVTGTGTGFGVYSGASGRPNVFQGTQVSANRIQFTGVPVDPPGVSGSRTFRITNLRSNANALGIAPPNVAPVSVFATITATPANSLAISGSTTQSVGSVQRGLSQSFDAPRTFRQCDSENPSLAVDPNSNGTSQFSLHVSELFATAFKKRNIGTTAANPTALANQNNLATLYGTESGFTNSSFPVLANRGNLGLGWPIKVPG